jgi:small ligand-binding sensory domain FIST
MASGASQPGQNLLLLNDTLRHSGAVGLTISGGVRVDCVVSQGCRAIGHPLIITKAHQNQILELGGKKTVAALQELAESLTDHEREMLSKGLLIGLAIDEYKDRFGRGDFLVRNVLGLDKKSGALAVGDLPRVGQTVQFHVRDVETAEEDLQLLLDAQQLDSPPLAGVLLTCNGRGTRLFGAPDHDAKTVRGRLGDLPLAGFFAAGEIGPIGNRSFLHSHTASLALFRSGKAADVQPR